MDIFAILVEFFRLYEPILWNFPYLEMIEGISPPISLLMPSIYILAGISPPKSMENLLYHAFSQGIFLHLKENLLTNKNRFFRVLTMEDPFQISGQIPRFFSYAFFGTRHDLLLTDIVPFPLLSAE